MNKKFAVFDMDGTLVDSMGYWNRLSVEFLRRKGVSYVPADVLESIKPMTMSESAALFVQAFSLEDTPERIEEEMNHMMDEHYHRDIPLKEGIREYLENLHQKGVAMCVASATAEPLMEACLSRLGVRGYFEFVLSCEMVGAGKSQPDIYLKSARRLGCAPYEAAVYEDALYAAKTAKKAGFYVVGVYDESARDHWKELESLADEMLMLTAEDPGAGKLTGEMLTAEDSEAGKLTGEMLTAEDSGAGKLTGEMPADETPAGKLPAD